MKLRAKPVSPLSGVIPWLVLIGARFIDGTAFALQSGAAAMPKNVPNILIRPAVVADVPVILRFIRALAEYEKLAHLVVADEALLSEHLFGNHPAAEVLLAHVDDAPVGFALFFTTFSTFVGRPGIWLEDLLVLPDWRGRGIGTALLKAVAAAAEDRRCGRLEWSVLDWNAPAIAFYEKSGARIMNDWRICRVTGDALRTLAQPQD